MEERKVMSDIFLEVLNKAKYLSFSIFSDLKIGKGGSVSTEKFNQVVDIDNKNKSIGYANGNGSYEKSVYKKCQATDQIEYAKSNNIHADQRDGNEKGSEITNDFVNIHGSSMLI
jgi:hypothetical protein